MSNRTAPLSLWRIAQYFLNTLHSLFDGPQDIARAPIRTPKDCAQIRRWLRVGEALLRHLLVIEASALHLAPPRLRSARGPRVRRRIEFWSDKPEDWRVSFRCFYGPPASRRHAPGLRRNAPAGGTPALHKQFHDARPLAERYEAILRVFNEPAPYARRLARRLSARPAAIVRLMSPLPDMPKLIGDENYATLAQAAARSWHERPDTS